MYITFIIIITLGIGCASSRNTRQLYRKSILHPKKLDSNLVRGAVQLPRRVRLYRKTLEILYCIPIIPTYYNIIISRVISRKTVSSNALSRVRSRAGCARSAKPRTCASGNTIFKDRRRRRRLGERDGTPRPRAKPIIFDRLRLKTMVRRRRRISSSQIIII